jgi:hypothetical protein
LHRTNHVCRWRVYRGLVVLGLILGRCRDLREFSQTCGRRHHR